MHPNPNCIMTLYSQINARGYTRGISWLYMCVGFVYTSTTMFYSVYAQIPQRYHHI